VSVKTFAQNLFRRFGWDVHRTGYLDSEKILLARFLSTARPSTIFDVGANVGQYGLLLRECGFGGRIVSFEAIPSVYARLSIVAASDPNWIVAPCCALGRAQGEANINLSRNSVSSSILPMNEMHLKAAPDSRYVASEIVALKRMDDVAGPFLPANGRVLLKIDTQGYEEEVLAGAGYILQSVSALQLEMSVAPLYEGAPSLRRALELCEKLGFELHGLIPGFYDEKSGRLLQMDGLFLRNGIS
jgi:FkbM family methyltransferase